MPNQSGPTLLTLAPNQIRPNSHQPRQYFDETALNELAASLHEHGVLQPIIVRALAEGEYELIAGERRWQAAQRAGLPQIPALLLQASAQRAQELALIENLHRADLSPLEEAEAYRGLMQTLGLTQERLAERLGISRVAVTNRLRLLGLGMEARSALIEGRLTEGHARALLGLQGERQLEAVHIVLRGGLTVRQTEQLVRRLARQPERPRRATDVGAEALAEAIRQRYGARVRVRRGRQGLSVLLHFPDLEAAQALLSEQPESDW